MGGTAAPDRKVRVWIVAHLGERSGAPLVALQAAKALCADPRFEVRLFIPCGGGLAEAAARENVTHDVSSLIPRGFAEVTGVVPKLRLALSRARYSRDFRRILREYKPDVIYAHSVAQPLRGTLIPHGPGAVPVVWHVHETFDATDTTGLRDRAGELCAGGAAVIFCGWAAADAFPATPPGVRRVIIPNALPANAGKTARGVENDDCTSMRKSLDSGGEAVVALFAGSLVRRKGVDVLCEAVRRVAAEHPGIAGQLRIWIAGEERGSAPEWAALLAAARADRALAPHLRWLGQRNDIPALLAAADFFLLPSRNEGLPLGVLEAFAAGRPALVTDVGDGRRLVEGTFEGVAAPRGIVVPREDPAALAAALARMVQDAALRRAAGEAARALVDMHFQFPLWTQRIAEVLEAAAAQRR